MSGRGARELRYRIVDEPRHPRFARFAISPMWFLLPLTIHGALNWSWLFWLLPGINGLMVAGRHRWRDIGLSVLALAIFIAGAVTLARLHGHEIISGLPRLYLRDLLLALTVLPLIRVTVDQQATIDLRRALRAQ